MSTIPLRIRKMLKAYEWSAPKLAKYSGVPLPSIKSILHGHSSNPRQKTLKALARAFNCSVADFNASPDAPVNVKKSGQFSEMPPLSKTKEEELVKAAICLVDEVARDKNFDLIGRDELKGIYVCKLVEFAMGRAENDDVETKVDKVYAQWLVGQEIA